MLRNEKNHGRLLTMIFALSASVTAFAAESNPDGKNRQADIGLYARYMDNTHRTPPHVVLQLNRLLGIHTEHSLRLSFVYSHNAFSLNSLISVGKIDPLL